VAAVSTGVVSTYDEITDGQDLAVGYPDTTRTERWVWRDGKMFRHGSDLAVDPFFFTGLMAKGLIHHGDFAPPVVGEWFSYRNGRRPYYQFFVAGVSATKVDFLYFSRGEYAGWHNSTVENIFDDFSRLTEVPTITPEMFQSVAINARESRDSAEGLRQQGRNMRDAMQSIRYARDYMNQAMEYAERRTT
jgi:hypothetical protein